MTTPPQDGGHPSARLIVPAAEIDAGPEGPEVGAFFDLDGTLVAGYTAAAQTRDRLLRRDLRVAEFLTIVELAVQFRLGRRAFETLIEGSALTVKGRLAREVDASRKGPRVGAFFDLDGTLVAGFTAVVHTQDRLRRREVMGSTRQLTVVAQPGALLLRMPPESA